MSFSDGQIHDLVSLGLSKKRRSVVQHIFRSIPEVPDRKKINNCINHLGKAAELLSELKDSDPTLINELETLLGGDIKLVDERIYPIKKGLEVIVENFDGVCIQEISFNNNDSLKTNVVTPSSKNYRRFKALTDIWEGWGKKVATSISSEFITFLTVCIAGEYSNKSAERVRNNYRRYYQGLDVDCEKISESNNMTDKNILELTVIRKKGGKRIIKTVEKSVPIMTKTVLAQKIEELKKKRS